MGVWETWFHPRRAHVRLEMLEEELVGNAQEIADLKRALVAKSSEIDEMRGMAIAEAEERVRRSEKELAALREAFDKEREENHRLAGELAEWEAVRPDLDKALEALDRMSEMKEAYEARIKQLRRQLADTRAAETRHEKIMMEDESDLLDADTPLTICGGVCHGQRQPQGLPGSGTSATPDYAPDSSDWLKPLPEQ